MSNLLPGKSIWIASPEDAYVVFVAESGSRVRKGQEIFEFHSPNLESTIVKANAFLSVIEISMRPWSDGRMEIWIDGLRDELNASVVRLEAARALHDRIQHQLEIGEMHLPDLKDSAASLSTAELDELTARRRLEYEPKRAADARDALKQGQSAIQRVLQNLEFIKKSLSVKAATDGVFMSMVGNGAFVEKGDICGEVSL